MVTKTFECVHGLLWKACAKCKDKTEAEIQRELEAVHKQNNIHYDYQEPNIFDEEYEEDRDYDIEIGND